MGNQYDPVVLLSVPQTGTTFFFRQQFAQTIEIDSMGNSLRDRDPSIYRLITIRTEGSHLWMKPSKEVRKTIGGVVACSDEAGT